jgi:hypothetical protein
LDPRQVAAHEFFILGGVQWGRLFEEIGVVAVAHGDKVKWLAEAGGWGHIRDPWMWVIDKRLK